jgi:hypothetical protein
VCGIVVRVGTIALLDAAQPACQGRRPQPKVGNETVPAQDRSQTEEAAKDGKQRAGDRHAAAAARVHV